MDDDLEALRCLVAARPAVAAVIAGQLCRLIGDLRLALACESPAEVKVSNAWQLVNAQAPPPGSPWEKLGLS